MPPADIVLCTEIIEHLDYSDMIALMRSLSGGLETGRHPDLQYAEYLLPWIPCAVCLGPLGLAAS